MHLPRYEYKTNTGFLDYEFISEGPKGKIKKIVRYTQIDDFVFNLAFGDLDEMTGEISDITVTNNDDSRKVLATVSATVYDFTNQYPGSLVVAKGTTLSRTRLYRMGITNYRKEISLDFELYGLKDGNWEPFTQRRDYEAFLIRRK
jgi:hypothetical protein